MSIRLSILHNLKNNIFIRDYLKKIEIAGDDPWNLKFFIEWDKIGKLEICSFEQYDIWALKEWWLNTLDFQTKALFPMFPADSRIERFLVNHYKSHLLKKCMIFNVWKTQDNLKESSFEDIIIGHFLLSECKEDKSFLGLCTSSKFQGKSLGKLFISIIAYISKFLNKEILWLTTGKDNVYGYKLYKNMGFVDTGEIEVNVPAENYKRIDREMKLILKNFK